MSRQLTFDFPEPAPVPAVAQTLEQRFADIENSDDCRLAKAVSKNRWHIDQLLKYMFSGKGVISAAQQETAGRILNAAQRMVERRQELFLGKAILRMQPRIRATKMPMLHRITVGELRRAGKHLPYAKPKDDNG